MLPPETQKLITDFCAQVAADLTARLLEATGKRVARRFEAPPRQTALREALAEGLESAFERLPLTTDLRDHYLDLFRQFMQREAVVEELCAMIDPNPGTPLDLPRLRTEFVAAGFDPDHLPGTNLLTAQAAVLGGQSPAPGTARGASKASEQLTNFDELILALVGAFYNAAANKPELQAAIQIGLLRQLAEDSGALRLLSERTANATERTAIAAETSADQLGKLLKLATEGKASITEFVQAARATMSHEPGKELDTYQAVAAGLRRGGSSITVEPNGGITVRVEPAPQTTSHVDWTPVRELVEELRRGIIQPDAPPSPEEIAQRRDRYCQLLISLYGQLRFQGLSTSVRPIDLPLEQVYVHLRAVAETPEAADEFSPEERRLLRLLEEKEGGRDEDLREAHLRLDALRRERWTRDRLERFPIAEALRDAERRGLVILGDPGSGKSTLLHFVALVFARGPEAARMHLALTGSDADRLPIIAPLAAYDEMLNHDSELTVREFLARYYDARQNLPGLGPAFEAALNAGRALVLLDGLDEVVEEGRRKFVADRASAFIREALQNGNRALLTSRIYGYRAAPLSVSLPHVTVLDFRREEIELFARQWSRAMAAWDAGGQLAAQDELRAQDEERRLLEQIRSNPGVERLAVNPLLLTMLALLHRQVGTLPQRRIKLYDLYFDALIQNWEENRSRGARLDRPQRIDTLEAENILTPLALWLQGHRASGTATRPDLMAQVIRFYLRDAGLDPDAPDVPLPALRAAERRAEVFLDDMRQFSGLLVERGQNAFGFRHLTFQEYFAGRELARKEPDERWAKLKPNLHANRWREPILLAAARLGVTLNRGDLATTLVEQILDAGSEHEAILHRDLFLAADCAADDIGVELLILRRIVEGLAPLAVSPIPSLSIGATRRLSKLAQLRAGDKPRVPEALEALSPTLETMTQETRAATLEAIYPVWFESPRLHGSIKKFIAQDIERPLYQDGTLKSFKEFAPFLQTSRELASLVAAKLDNKSEYVRGAAIEALASLLGEHANLRAVIAAKLNDKSGYARSAVIEVLAPLLSEYSNLRAAVIAKLDDEDNYMRGVVIRTLVPLLGEHANLYAIIAAKLNDKSEYVRSAVIEALAPLLSEYPDLRAAVVAKLDDEDNYVRGAAIWTLVPLLGKHPDLYATVAAGATKLVDEDNDESAWVRGETIQALAPLLGEHPNLYATIVTKLVDEDNNVRGAAIEALSKFVSRDGQIATAIHMLLEHHDWNTRRDTVNALEESLRIGAIHPDLIRQKLTDEHCLESLEGVTASVHALAGLLSEDANLRATIAAKLNDKSDDVRGAAIEALAPLLSEHPDLRTAITAKLNDKSDDVRGAAIEALAPLLGEHANLRAEIAAKLDDKSNDVRGAAIEALAPLLSEHPDLRAAVGTKFEEDDDDEVRSAAIWALAPLLGEHTNLRAAIIAKLEDKSDDVRSAAIWALAPLLSEQANLRTAIIAKFEDPSEYVRLTVIEALAPLLGEHANLRTDIAAKLDDAEWDVRKEAIIALAPLTPDDLELRQRLIPILGTDDDEAYIQSDYNFSEETGPRAVLVKSFGQLAARDLSTRAEMIELLSSPDWRMRQSAAEVLAAAGKECVLEAVPQLLKSLEDYRGGDSWPARIAAAELLINDYRYSAEAIETIMPALDYGAHPLVIVPNDSGIRQQAALALGKLKAEYRQPHVFARLERLLNEEQDPQVLDGAFNALLSLAAAEEE